MECSEVASRLAAVAADDRKKEREFYRYYHTSQSPKSKSPAPVNRQPAVASTPEPPPTTESGIVPSSDQALTAFAQLGALRLNTRRCLISFFDRKNCYIVAEATKTSCIHSGKAQLPEDSLAWGETSFDSKSSICTYTAGLPMQYAEHDPTLDITSLVVNDLRLDERFKNYPFVTGPPYSRFYAGVPIRSPSGISIGSYCVLDEKPRDGISPVELVFLQDMAHTVMKHLEMRRATDDQRRGGVMVRSLGAFAEGKSSADDWWHDPWDTPPESDQPATAPSEQATQSSRRKTLSTAAPLPVVTPEGNLALVRNDSIDSSIPSLKSPTSPESVPPGSVVITPASEAPNVGQETAKSATAAEDGSQHERFGPEMKATFGRAASMIMEATEVDGVVIFDASVSTFGGLVDDELAQEQTEPPKQDKPCAVLGAIQARRSLSAMPTSRGPQSAMTESVLRHLIRSYPRGQIFNFDDNDGTTTVSGRIEPESATPTPFPDIGFSPAKRTGTSSTWSQDDESLLRDVFPQARSVVLYPLWDVHRDRWFAGTVIWSADPMRVFTSEQELSYLAAFGTSAMAEVARLDTKFADDAKGDFISSISHELRSPLHGILGSCELLKDTEIDAFQSGLAHTVETCGKTLLDTINHVLDYAKINSLNRGTSKRKKKKNSKGSKILTPGQAHANDIMTLISDVDLSVLTEEVLETVFAGHTFAKTAAAAISSYPSSSDGPTLAVVVDINKSDNYCFRTQPGAWRRILMNLFGNALKYTPAGFIKVKLQVSSGGDDDSREVRLTITDSGIGMSDDYIRHRLWHSFAQEDPLSQGTGLGLSIVKQIVKSLGGDIDVVSQKGLGTKFIVSCPLKLAMFSPGVAASVPEKEVQTTLQRTRGMRVSFIGFDQQDGYFPVKNLKNKNATDLTLKALDNLCTEWFGMTVVPHNPEKNATTDLIVATEAGAKVLRQQNMSDPNSTSLGPVIVVCQGPASASAQSTTSITVPGRTFECISQPCGPHKLAKALQSCLDRHANRTMIRFTETDTDPMVSGTEESMSRLNLGDVQSKDKHKENIRSPLLSPPEVTRPPMSTALSAPEIGSIAQSPIKKSVPPPASGRALHILAVDDNPINLRLIRTFIEKLHHTHTLATNGVEAVSTFKNLSPPPTLSGQVSATAKRHFDAILMDINMPEMDGLEATRQIRAYEREVGLQPATIIALTGLASTAAQKDAYTSGINLFLIKPVSFANISVVLQGVVTSDAADKTGAENAAGSDVGSEKSFSGVEQA